MREVPTALVQLLSENRVGVPLDLGICGGSFSEVEVSIEALPLVSTHRGYRLVGDRDWFLKLYRSPRMGAEREVRILGHLAGVGCVPEFGGAIVEREPAGAGAVLGMIQRWESGANLWAVLEKGGVDSLGAFDGASLGRSLRELHRAMACIGVDAVSADGGLGTLEDEMRQSLLSVEEAVIERWIDTLRDLRGTGFLADGTSVIHGDMHLGQVLLTGEGRHLFFDFEGEPHVNVVGGGLVGECPLRDVAGMLRSFGYLGDALGCADPIRAMKATFLEGYFPDGMCERDERLLKAFCVQRAFREWLYERAHRPDWAQRPLRVPLF